MISLIVMVYSFESNFPPLRRTSENRSGSENELPETTLQEIEKEMRDLGKLDRALNGALGEEISRVKERWEGIPLSPDGRIDFTADFFAPDPQDVAGNEAWERNKARIDSWGRKWDEEEEALVRAINNEIEQKLYDSRGNVVESPRYSSKALRAHRELERLRTGEIFEKYKTYILNRFLGAEFIVMRSSRHDDVVNGIDNVIVDTLSGEIVCAFDEVVSESADIRAEKSYKVEKRNIDGSRTLSGGRTEYAVTIRNGKAEKTSAVSVPVFYLCMGKNELVENLRGIGNTQVEREVFTRMLRDIEAQVVQFDNFSKKSELFNRRLDEFIKGVRRSQKTLKA